MQPLNNGYSGVESDMLTNLQLLSSYGMVEIKSIALSKKMVKEEHQGINNPDALIKIAGHDVTVEDLPIGMYYRITLNSKVVPRDIAQLLASNRIPFTTG